MSSLVSRVSGSVRARSRTYWRRFSDWTEVRRRHTWPDCGAPEHAETNAGLISSLTVSCNTRVLTLHLLYTLFSSGVAAQLRDVVVVDNGSNDGTVPFLEALHDAGLIVLLRNRWPPYHGPGINRGLTYLAGQPGACRLAYVWILDSDIVVVRSDVLQVARAAAVRERAAMLGERRPDTELVDLCSILIDPRRVWTRVMPVFQEHGLPSDLLQRTTVAAGAGLGYFPFTADGHLIHVGGGTLETLGALDNPRNAYRDGARLQELAGKRVPRHFQGVPGARSTYEQLMGEFERATSGLDPGEFAALLQTIADHRG